MKKYNNDDDGDCGDEKAVDEPAQPVQTTEDQ